ncbi:regulator of RNase E activity RraA [Stella humosa]|uniref:Regulator of RNase E activity RraA n=1 Tax=Stella humosa TaxID=94 RepID=A0A3N1MEM5_9PROT|nr:ribonuclease activity regulator RraA [Stella humosa]ROQ01170.1 regulator of RNase E activity RraA [Stella humosa]BBK31545.1 ribonuclease activity regulator RraA [Stella humosa]
MPAIEAMPLPPGVTELLLQASTATITMQLLKRGFRGLAINGVRPMNPAAARFAGPAVTLRYIPGREDICQAPKPTDPDSAQRIAIEGTPAGHVLVIGTEREIRAGTLGDILAWRLKMRGIAAVVSDGAMRDAPVMAGIDLPIFAAANAAPASMTNLHPVEVQVPIGCGGVPVFPGDALVGDLDGVVVIPRHLVEEVARDSAEQERMERFVQREVRRGRAIGGLYPPDDATKAQYRDWLQAGEPED